MDLLFMFLLFMFFIVVLECGKVIDDKWLLKCLGYKEVYSLF